MKLFLWMLLPSSDKSKTICRGCFGLSDSVQWSFGFSNPERIIEL